MALYEQVYNCYISSMGIQSGTERTVYVVWEWDRGNTDHFEVKWTYTTDDGMSWDGSETNASGTTNTALWNAPSNASTVTCKVKPVAETHKSGDSEVSYWYANWCNAKSVNFAYVPPSTPSAPSISVDGYKCKLSLSNISSEIRDVEFELMQDDRRVFQHVFCYGIRGGSASSTVTIAAGSKYKARARVRKGRSGWSDWSNYSSEIESPPKPVEKISTIRALTETSVYLSWPAVSTAEKYEIEYTTNKEYFDSSSEPKSLTIDAVVTHAEVTGLESGNEWFFRVKAVNDSGESGASPIASVKIGTAPAPPTTWSSTTTITVGTPLNLYWSHNSEDGSIQTFAEIELIIGGVSETHIIQNQAQDEEPDSTKSYTVNTSSYTEGTRILWRVRTKGIIDRYSDWSIQREVNVYAPPSLFLALINSKKEPVNTLHSFPFRIVAQASPYTQKPIGYHISIIANDTYVAANAYGNEETINSGEEVYSKYINCNGDLDISLGYGDLALENNIEYTVKCTVSMNSGLIAEASYIFDVAWGTVVFCPDAEIGYNSENYTTAIRPFCYDDRKQLMTGITLSVYRRNFDGTFTELATKIPNEDSFFVTDPHPSLDYARYRIVATDLQTGRNNYYDIPGYPIHEPSIILQWNERWSNFNEAGDQVPEEPIWSGSLLRLSGNIDITEKQEADISLVKYIGRSYPVSYYGTQLGTTSTWSVDVPKRDKETVYALRRLALWMGDVYVREPSGGSYWANVNVSFTQNHLETVIPVTLEVTRVAGGV